MFLSQATDVFASLQLPLRGPHVHGKGAVGGIGGATVEKLDAHHIVVDIFHHRALAHRGALSIIQGKVHAERLVEADGMFTRRPKAEPCCDTFSTIICPVPLPWVRSSRWCSYCPGRWRERRTNWRTSIRI